MRFTWFALGLLAWAGCRRSSGTGDPGSGELGIEWKGETKQGRAVLPARASLCRETGLVELLAARGDTGLGLALFPSDSARLVAADYPVVSAGTEPEPRPGANLALRWFDQTTFEAFEGISGSVQLESAGAVLSGTVEARLRAVESADSLQVTARFNQVPFDTAASGCGAVQRRNRV